MSSPSLHLTVLTLILFITLLTSSINALNYNDPCLASSDMCSTYLGMSCRNGNCKCTSNVTTVFYDTSKGRCILPMGSPCDPSSQTPCVEGYCPGYWTGLPSTCQCFSGRPADDRLSCLKSVNAACTSDKECDSSALLACRNGQCACPGSALENYFDSQKATCRVNIGSSCRLGSKLSCDPDVAECVPVQSNPSEYVCMCSKMYPVQTRTAPFSSITMGTIRDCVKVSSYGGTCIGYLTNNTGSSNSAIKEICDGSALLTCLNGICSCAYAPDQRWDPIIGACASGPKGRCFITNNKFVEPLPQSYFELGQTRRISCAIGLQCIPTESPSPTSVGVMGICK